MGSLTQAHGTLTKGSTSTLGGQPVIALNSSKGGTMYVATTGTPYPLQVSKNSGGQSGKVTFSDYNKAFTITAPANSINIDQLDEQRLIEGARVLRSALRSSARLVAAVTRAATRSCVAGVRKCWPTWTG